MYYSISQIFSVLKGQILKKFSNHLVTLITSVPLSRRDPCYETSLKYVETFCIKELPISNWIVAPSTHKFIILGFKKTSTYTNIHHLYVLRTSNTFMF